jgi:hypothetical protein
MHVAEAEPQAGAHHHWSHLRADLAVLQVRGEQLTCRFIICCSLMLWLHSCVTRLHRLLLSSEAAASRPSLVDLPLVWSQGHPAQSVHWLHAVLRLSLFHNASLAEFAVFSYLPLCSDAPYARFIAAAVPCLNAIRWACAAY